MESSRNRFVQKKKFFFLSLNTKRTMQDNLKKPQLKLISFTIKRQQLVYFTLKRSKSAHFARKRQLCNYICRFNGKEGQVQIPNIERDRKENQQVAYFSHFPPRRTPHFPETLLSQRGRESPPLGP